MLKIPCGGFWLDEKSFSLKDKILSVVGLSHKLTFTGAVSKEFDGSSDVTINIPSDEHINSLINTALGVIENGTY